MTKYALENFIRNIGELQAFTEHKLRLSILNLEILSITLDKRSCAEISYSSYCNVCLFLPYKLLYSSDCIHPFIMMTHIFMLSTLTSLLSTQFSSPHACRPCHKDAPYSHFKQCQHLLLILPTQTCHQILRLEILQLSLSTSIQITTSLI